MSHAQSEDEVRARNVAAMGDELGSLFSLLSTELTWAGWRWVQHRELFGSENPERLRLINASAPFFFHIIQQVLWEDVFLAIARLGGPGASRGRPNLALIRLVPLVAESIRAEVEQKVRELQGDSSFAIDWRNRRIAHRDLDLAAGQSAHPLAIATRAAVDRSLADAAGILNRIERHYLQSTTIYDGGYASGGARALLSHLRDAAILHRLQDEEINSRQYNPRLWGDNAPAV